MLDFFEKNHDHYIQSLKSGVWLPIPEIVSGGYKVSLIDESKVADLNHLFKYDSFNLEISDNAVWICDIGKLLSFDKTLFQDRDEIFYYDLDKIKVTSGLRVPMPNGKYLVSILGSLENQQPCFSFVFKPVSEFDGFKDPREDEKYSFQFDEIK
ncbi:hypothetical protein A4G20_06475 [Pasteurellaceae bacterium RH1A]|nr:hypothetical protein A4G20_06475 [Pasteurellaceae bacterium RH1A]